MTSPDLVHHILTCSDQSFSNLVQEASLDLSTDLIGCDLSYVDFGNISVKVLNLKNCILKFADLSRVKGRIILENAIIEGALLPSTRIDKETTEKARKRIAILKDYALFVSHYKINDQAGRNIYRLLERNSTVISLLEDSTQIGQQCEAVSTFLYESFYRDNLKRSNKTQYGGVVTIAHRRKTFKKQRMEVRSNELDDLFMDDIYKADVVMRPIPPKGKLYGTVASINLFDAPKKGEQISHSSFYFLNRMKIHFASDKSLIVIMSNIQPPSDYFFDILLGMTPSTKYVFLLRNEEMQRSYSSSFPTHALANDEYILSPQDIGNFIKESEVFNNTIILSKETEQELYNQVGQPLIRIKSLLNAKIFKSAKVLSDKSHIFV